uniref:Cytochrome P450 2K1-like n=1 Tax=Neogobius melanostomus TaxID=47308 RepID=A0A8C6TLX4_9GOBI
MGFTDALLSSPGTVLGAVLVLLLFYLFYGLGSDQGPPGPRPFPVVGNLLQLDLKQPYNTLMEYSKQYGSVFTVWLGPKKVVVLAGYKTVKEALVDNADVFGDRDPLFLLCPGVIWSNHELWREVRRFALTNLRDYGMGKRACEDKITEEAQYLCDVFKNFKGKPLDTTQPMNQAVSNIICSMVYGSRFEYDDPKFVALVSDANRIIQIAGSPSVQIYNLFPWLGRLVPKRNEFINFQELEGDAKPQMCRGFVDSFLIRQKKVRLTDNSLTSSDNLLQTVLQLFNAGTDTTATTLRWGLLIMAKYPHLQDQVREEISRVIGSRQVLIEDRKDLPFTDAVIHETQRIANIVPMAIPHRTSQDITFQGHFIKKGTTVFPLLTSVLYDESQWEKPHSFHPAHFLDKDGKFVKRDAFMPFSAGRRICLGEGLARMELFIFFVTLMQRFRFTAPPGVSEEELELVPRVGFTLNPTAHELCAVPCL